MLRGQRFEVNLDDTDDDNARRQSNVPLPAAFVGDVLERQPRAAQPPTAPVLKSRTGFPEHQRRNVGSRFKLQKKQQHSPETSSRNDTSEREVIGVERASPAHGDEGGVGNWEQEERARIDEENQQKLAQMSPDEIEEERRALMESLSPGMIQRLLQRSNIDSGSAEADISNTEPAARTRPKDDNAPKKSVSFADSHLKENAQPKKSVRSEAEDHIDSTEETSPEDQLPHDSVHFPQPTQPPDLDPSSSTFLQDLHQKYFPSLPSDPEKLEWMQTSTNSATTYDPAAAGIDPKNLRFSFKGELIAPRTAAQIPVTAGLHHHADAPEAAGYTIPELVHLGHSSFAPQRCIAFQTLGRLLYRLGKGEFGDSGEPGAGTEGSEETFGALARGIWRVVEAEKVIALLVMESEGRGVDGGKHVSAKAYATEAVWLWQRGGGRSWKAE